MVIDFHTHCFPDKIAEKAISQLGSLAKIKNETDGTVSDLLRKMNDWNIDRSVVLNIATNPKQQENVNTFAIETNKIYGNKLTALGSVHPASDRIKEEIIRLKDNNINGIKLHPDYMTTLIDDDKFKPIFKLCCEYDMFVTIHSGFDVISPNLIHATPERVLKIINEFPNLKLIASHMGANDMWDETEKYLIGKNVYIDTSMACVFNLPKSQAERMIKNHDPDKVLFGSDAPWCAADVSLAYLNSLNISENLKEMIRYKNAELLL